MGLETVPYRFRKKPDLHQAGKNLSLQVHKLRLEILRRAVWNKAMEELIREKEKMQEKPIQLTTTNKELQVRLDELDKLLDTLNDDAL